MLIGLLQVPEFLAVEKKTAISYGFVLAPAAPVIKGDVHPADEEFVAHEKAVRILQGALPCTDRLDLRSHQLDAGGVRLQELVVERGSAVLDLYAAFGFGHRIAKVIHFP